MPKKLTRSEKREAKRKIKMRISGKSVFKIQEIIIKKSKKKPHTPTKLH